LASGLHFAGPAKPFFKEWRMASGSSSFKSTWDAFMAETRFFLRDIGDWFGDRSDGERLLLAGLILLGLIWVVVRQPNDVRNSGGAARQFAIALVLAAVLGAGVMSAFDGWLDISIPS
jgi:nitrate/nitrite transporter NarK